MNVLITSDGPVVIDWANAARGDPAFDVADTWVLFACADPPLSRVERALAPVARRIFLRNFLHRVDRQAAWRAIPAAVEARSRDRNMTTVELARMQAMAARAAN